MTQEDSSVNDMMCLMAGCIIEIARSINKEHISTFIQAILDAKRIYVTGAGRSGLVAKAFAMRLMHTGFPTYVVGETITPAITEGDLMIVFSGSGNTKTISDIAEMTKNFGGKVALISSDENSSIGKIADFMIKIENQRYPIAKNPHKYEIHQMLNSYRSFAPLGTIFETSSLIFSDAIISTLMNIKKIDESELKRHHTNIE